MLGKLKSSFLSCYAAMWAHLFGRTVFLGASGIVFAHCAQLDGIMGCKITKAVYGHCFFVRCLESGWWAIWDPLTHLSSLTDTHNSRSKSDKLYCDTTLPSILPTHDKTFNVQSSKFPVVQCILLWIQSYHNVFCPVNHHCVSSNNHIV